MAKKTKSTIQTEILFEPLPPDEPVVVPPTEEPKHEPVVETPAELVPKPVQATAKPEAPKLDGVLLVKSGGFLRFVPQDIRAKIILDEVNNRQVVDLMRKPSWYGIEIEGDPAWPKDKIPLFLCLNMGLENHPKIQALRKMGITIHIETGLNNYMKKAKRRSDIELAAYPRYEQVSDVPLFDRCVEGMILRCTKDFKDGRGNVIFKKDNRYSVCKTGNEGEESISVSYTPVVPGAQIDNNSFYTWTEFDDDMENHFSDTDIEEKAPTIIDLFPDAIREIEAKAKKLPFIDNIYEHVATDAKLMALKRGSFNTYLPRMGKTSSAIMTIELRGTKRVGVIVPNNARKVWVKELKRLGFSEGKDYVSVKCLADLKKESKYYLITQNWLRFAKDIGEDKRGTKDSILAPSYYHEKVKLANGKSQTVKHDNHRKCPKCSSLLQRYGDITSGSGEEKTTYKGWTATRGYRCRASKTVKGKIVRCGYVDYELAAHANCEDEQVKGRQCPTCKVADSTWIPGRYKRVKKEFNACVVDEIHNAKNDTSLTNQSVFNMRAKIRMGLSGTPISSSAMDTYNPLQWLMNAPGLSFPFDYKNGKMDFENRFCEKIFLEKPVGSYTDENGKIIEIKKTTKKIIPFLKNPADFWKFTSGKIIRRTYNDPVYLKSLAKAGKYMPESKPSVYKVKMVPAQAKLMLDSIVDFRKAVEEMQKAKATAGHEMNMAMVQNMAQMVTLRILATCPEYLNQKLGKEVYKGVPGGGKLAVIVKKVAESIKAGKKVVILTDFQAMQKTVADALKPYGVMHLKTSWNEDKRAEGIEEFQENPKYNVFIAGTRTIREAVDLSVADVCICCDLLWSMPFQSQAWSRILAPTNIKRECEIVLLCSEGTIDDGIYERLYHNLIGAEQALDRKSLNRRAKLVNVKEFLDQLLHTEKFLRQFDFAEEEVVMPVVKPRALSYGAE